MLRLYVPVAVTIVLIGALTACEGVYSDRFRGSSVNAEEFGKRFKNVPMKVGLWEGEDRPVDAKTLEVAGAVNHVSRVYKNPKTGQQVDLWLVVGHARDIGRHTPDVCYLAQGFSQDGDKLKHLLEVDGELPARFFTARFRREDQAGTISGWSSAIIRRCTRCISRRRCLIATNRFPTMRRWPLRRSCCRW
jgi:hypothetical protein